MLSKNTATHVHTAMLITAVYFKGEYELGLYAAPHLASIIRLAQRLDRLRVLTLLFNILACFRTLAVTVSKLSKLNDCNDYCYYSISIYKCHY